MRNSLALLASAFLALALPASLRASPQESQEPQGRFSDASGRSIDWYASAPLESLPESAVIVVAAHGFKDHAFNYTGRATRENPLLASLPKDAVTVSFNQPTFGAPGAEGSAPLERVDSVAELAERYYAFLREISARFPRNPVLAFGHSLGGLTVATALELHRSELPSNLRAALLSAPALGLPPTLVDRWIKAPGVKLLGGIPGIRNAPAVPDFLPAKDMVNPYEQKYRVRGGNAYSEYSSLNVALETIEAARESQNPIAILFSPVAAGFWSAFSAVANLFSDPERNREEIARLESDPRVRNKLHTLRSARATILGMQELARLQSARSAPLPIPVGVAHFDRDRVTAPEASFAYIEAERAKEKASGLGERSIWVNGVPTTRAASVTVRARHALPTHTEAPLALEALLAANPSVHADFGSPELRESRHGGIRLARRFLPGLPRKARAFR